MSATRTGVLVIGAGFAGIGMGAALRRQGRDDFIVLERADEVGGTWRDNTYPGIACDIPSHVYSFSFRPYAAWSRLFPEGAEILSYLRWVAEQEGVLDRIRFGSEVQRMRWDDEAGVWRCSTARGEYIAEALILACGRLSEPKLPPVPGIESFETAPGRALMHSARWRHDVEFAGRRVAIVGSGASAVQLIPELARAVGELTVLQRSAPYVVPRRNRAYSAAERRMFERVPESMARAREQWFWQQERVFAQRALVAEEVEAARELALGHLAAQVADPVLRRRLTPRYEIGCKRVLLSDDYYPAFERQRVALVDSPLAAVEPGVLIARDGTRVEADIAVFATGFQSTRQPYADRVFGEGGRSLAEEWASGMYAYASVAVPGFPNLFVMNGPNAGLGHNSAIPMLETQIGYATQALQHLATHPGERLSVARDRAEEWARMIDEMSAGTVWMRGGCESWYKDPESGRLTLLWPGSTMSFRAKAGVFFSAASHYAT